MKGLVAFLCLFFVGPVALAGNLWIPPKGTLRSTVSLTGAQWDQFLQRGTSAVELPGEISQFEVTGYFEYSPMENLSFDLTLPVVVSQKEFVYLETDPTGSILGVQTGPNGEVRDIDTNAGLGDTIFGSNYVFWDKYLTLGGRLHVKVPGTYDSGDVVNAPGDGQTDIGASLLMGMVFAPFRMYFRGQAGFTYRTGEPPHQVDFLLEPGVFITRRLSGRFLYRHIESLGGDDISYYGYSNFYPSNNEDLDRIGLGLSYKTAEGVGFFADYAQTIAGRNTANTKAITIGVDLSF